LFGLIQVNAWRTPEAEKVREEAAMQTSPRQNERGTIAEIVAHSWQYWRAKRGHLAELEYTGPDEMERMARELGLTTSDLGALAAKGTVDAADLLPRRMASLHLDVAELSRAQPIVLREMQRLCTMCESKRRCTRDLARGAHSSAWHSYCPNHGTLRALAPQAVGKPDNAEPVPNILPVPEAVELAGTDQRRMQAMLLGLLLLGCAWLTLNTVSPQLANFLLDPGSIPLSALASSDATLPPNVTCLDSGCLTAQQRAALQTVKTFQAQGLVKSSIDQVQAVQQVSSAVRNIQAAEALACAKERGTASYGAFFQEGCSPGAIRTAKWNGYDNCRPMAAGGVCFFR